MVALTTTAIAGLAFAVIVIGFIVYAAFNVRAGRAEVGSEIELAPNRKEYYDDETLEGPRLERLQLLGVASAARQRDRPAGLLGARTRPSGRSPGRLGQALRHMG